MKDFRQNSSLTIASPQALTELSQKEEATALVISDSHGYAAQIFFAVKEAGKNCDALFFCGDGMSDLCLLLQKAGEDESLAECIPPVICFVEGNCDTEYYPVKDGLIRVPLTQTVQIAGHTVLCTHGHRFSLYAGTTALENAAQRNEADIVLYGHTHIAQSMQQGQLLIANPGSCAKPRGGQPNCYALLKVRKNEPYPEFTVYQINPNGSTPYPC
mgnify:CR=1 FL=1